MKKRVMALVLSVLMVVLSLPLAALDFKETGYLWGDVNRDLGVDNRDATAMLRSLASWGIDLDAADADVNVDDAFDNRDVTMMLRYLAGWDVVLGEESMYEDVVLASGGQTNYRIVYNAHLGYMGENGDRFGGEEEASQDFYAYAKYETGLGGLTIGNDEEGEESDYEILVGITNREGEDTYTIPRETLEDEGFIIRQYGKKIIIAGGTDEGTILGLDYFTSTFLLPYKLALAEDPDAELVIPGGYYHVEKQTYNVGKITIGGVDLSEFTIVHGKDAFIAEETAALELQHYLYRATGIKLPVVTDDAEPAEHEIIVGLTNREGEDTYTIDREAYGDDGFVIKMVGDDLVIAGGFNDGTIYGAYTFLEEYVGYRWYESFVSTLPEQDLVEIPADLENEQIPVFSLERAMYWECVINQDFIDGFQTKNKVIYNVNEIPQAYAGQQGLGTGGPGGHSFARWYPEVGSGSQPCLSDPVVYETMLTNIVAYLDAHPNCEQLSVSQNDNANYCRCENCQAIVDQYGGVQSGIIIWFVNQIAEALEEAGHGDVLIHTFAYMYTVDAPTGIVCHDNIIVELCTMNVCFSHPLTANCLDYGQINLQFRTQVARWSEIAMYLQIWDYPTDFSYPLTPVANFTQIMQSYRFLATTKVERIFSQGYTNNHSGEFFEARSYYTAKVLWDPTMTTETAYGHLDEFMADYYGPGWESIRTYIDIMDYVSRQDDNHWGCYSPTTDVIPTEDFLPYIEDIEALWDAAEEAAGDNARWLTNVQRSRISAEYAILNAMYEEVSVSEDEALKAEYNERLEALAQRTYAFRVTEEGVTLDLTLRPQDTFFDD